MQKLFAILLSLVAGLSAQKPPAQEPNVEPTWLRRALPSLRERQIDLSSPSCHYSPIFGEGDAETRLPLAIARFGELTIDPRGLCQTVEYSREEELYFVLDGRGALRVGEKSYPLAKEDFTYIPPAAPHSLSSSSADPLRLVIATVKIPPETSIAPPRDLIVANLSELKEQTVEGHPQSVLYKLLVGPRTANRDRINAAYRVADFFLMDFAPAGTNLPHHHEIAEEIYLVLDGEGQIAAGGGMDGVEGLHPAKAGDAYYFRPNCTVGFYNQNAPGAKAHILAVRALVAMPTQD